jgi:hypothetical protein
MNSAHFTERHEQDVMVSEANDFCERTAIVPRGFNTADFANSAERAFGFDDETDELDDAPAIFNHTGVARALECLREALAGAV